MDIGIYVRILLIYIFMHAFCVIILTLRIDHVRISVNLRYE